MVTYAAGVRRQWFDMEQSKGFILGKIGVDLLRNITEFVTKQDTEMAEVKSIHNPEALTTMLISFICFFSSALKSFPLPRHLFSVLPVRLSCDAWYP